MNSEEREKDQSAQHSNDKAAEQREHTDPPIPKAPASPAKPPPAETHSANTQNPERDWWDKTKRWVELSGVVLLALYTTFTIKMYFSNKKSADAAKSAAETAACTLKDSEKSFAQTLCQMQAQTTAQAKAAGATVKANEITRDAVIHVQRAFVLPGSVDSTVIGPNGTQSLLIRFHWENSGSTPTRFMKTHVSFIWQTEVLPDNFGFPDLWAEGPHTNRPAVIGPKGSTSVTVGPIPVQVLNVIASHQFHLYLWGWARYRDVFIDTPWHLTRFCYELIPENVEMSRDGQETFSFRFDSWKTHNCYDDECSDQK